MSSAGFLRNVPVLADLSDELLEGLSRQAREMHVAAGEWILHEGEQAGSVFIIRSGRVEVVDERPPETLIRVLRRGDVLGELALLRRSTRSASARARRDTELLELTRDAFEALIRDAPDFALALVRSIGAQLAASRAAVAYTTPPRSVAVIGLDPAVPVAEVAAQLAAGLAEHGSVAELSGGNVEHVDRAGERADRVVLAGGHDPGDAWADVCMREADVIVAVTSGRPDPAWLNRAAALHGSELLVFGPRLIAGAQTALAPGQTQIVADPARQPDALRALTRRLAGRSLGIVLSGGGARAFAHLGVLEELRAAGLVFDRISGVSLGSLVAATVAADFDPELRPRRLRAPFRQE